MENLKVCIIGAGSSGITTAKALHEANIPFDCFEIGSKIGGNWLYNNDNGVSSSYWSLHINTSKRLMEFSDFPMPDSYPEYASHEMIYDYFESYVDHFGFREHIKFNTKVENVEKLDDGTYMVYADKFPPAKYRAVIVANGHHWKPKWANFDGEFTGEVIHSHHYKTMQGFEDQRTLIIGIGNSAVDIACELSNVSKDVVISTRSGAYIMPKYMFGRPSDQLTKPPLTYLPLGIQRFILKIALWLNVGNQESYGVPKPKRPLLKEHPTLSQELLNKVGHGKVKIKPNISRFEGKVVHFTDGTQEEFDRIIYCTGYSIAFPFFEENFFPIENNEVPLYEFVVSPEHSNLFFVGLIQPIGSVMPLAELQAVWIANILNGKVDLPSQDNMNKAIAKSRERMRRRFGDSSRHTLEVDFFPYINKLRKLSGGR